MANLTARKKVLRGDAAKQKLREGVDIVYEAVAATLGPRSNNVALERPWGTPAVVHDGVTVAKEILPLQDEFANIGAEIIVQAADRTGIVGDGTTTATVLTHEIHRLAHKYSAAGHSIMGIRTGIERGVAAVADHIKRNAIEVSGTERLKQVARVSAQLEDIGEMVVTAVEQVGTDGVVTVEEAASTETYVEVKQGLEIAKGFKTPHFITNGELGEAEITDAHILVTDYKMSSMAELTPMLDAVVNKANIKKLVLIADDFDGEFLATLILNKIKGNLELLAVQAPDFGQKRLDVLQDIAVVTGATVISSDQGMDWKDFNVEHLGKASRVKSSDRTTIIVGGVGTEEAVAKRAAELKVRADADGVGEFEREKLLERHAKLTTGIAVVFVGAKTESEIKERKERAIDAISAVKAAAQEGIVPGGGVALIKAIKALDSVVVGTEDERIGVNVVRQACRAPFDRLLRNSGYDPGEFYAQVTNDDNIGVNVLTGQLIDLVAEGIIDPAKVVRAALENASSSAIMLATIDVIVVEERQREKEQNITAY